MQLPQLHHEYRRAQNIVFNLLILYVLRICISPSTAKGKNIFQEEYKVVFHIK